MVTLGFADTLIPKVLSGEKTKTWRLWGDKNLQTGDEIMFVTAVERKPFARARLTRVVEKVFKDITPEDQEGHETYQENIYEVYSKYYHKPVDEQTPLKIISFELLETFDLV